MAFLLEQCSFGELSKEVLSECYSFSCGEDDLDDFFNNDAPLYSNELLGKSYCFRLDTDNKNIVSAFTLSNDSIRIDDLPVSRANKIKKRTPHKKSMKRYPAVLIGRLGTNINFFHKGIGSETMDFIKFWFVNNNKTGCRFLIVDAYNNPKSINFYVKNGFNFLFSSESQELQYTKIKNPTNLKTRLMYYDLMAISPLNS